MESINKKNNLFEAAPLQAASNNVDQPLEVDVKKMASTSKKPLAKRSPLPEHSFVGGGSLLKPLLAKTPASTASNDSEILPASILTTSALTITTATTNHVEDAGAKQRRRRDTDSSTKSDKSDISLLSIESSNSVTSNTGNKLNKTKAENKKTPAKPRTTKGKLILDPHKRPLFHDF